MREKACVKCHKGDEKTIGDKLVKGGPLEPTPVKGKKGWIDLNVQVAYDASNAYFRLQWKTQNPYPGNEHVTFVRTLGFGTSADIQAVRLP